MQHSTFNYVRTFRQRSALSEEELAYLINQMSHTAVSYFETGDRVPTLEGVLALQVIFGIGPRDMFPGYYERVEDGVMRRAAQLLARLEGKTDQRSEAKRQLLEAMPGRSEDNDQGL